MAQCFYIIETQKKMSKISKKSLKGRWEITEMDHWDVEAGWFIEFNHKDGGSFHFLCVDAKIDCRLNKGLNRTEFTFHGNDEMDETFGRGWVKVDGADLLGYLYFHQGDESGFKAKMMKSNKSKNKRIGYRSITIKKSAATQTRKEERNKNI